MLLSPIEEHVESSIDGGGIGRYRPLEQSETTSLLVARFRVRNANHAASLLCTRQFNQLVFVQSARYPRISDHRWLVGIVRLYRQRDQIIRKGGYTRVVREMGSLLFDDFLSKSNTSNDVAIVDEMVDSS